MRIVYSGMFLGEGLRLLGHEILPLSLRADLPFDALVAQACPEPDLVLLELWGGCVLPDAMQETRHRVAAYCIDTPLNAFWMRHFLKLCDDVFVDQQASVAQLAADGINAAWLPLCASEDDFMPSSPKEHFLTFVGRDTPQRVKRRNLLRLLKRHLPVTVSETLSRHAMQKLFARSQVVLNENLFSGLTLRVFQALASGSLLLTEAGGDGVDVHFRDREHLVCYEPANILDILSAMRRNNDAYREIARRGQELCRARHTSRARARTLLERIVAGPGNNARPVGLRRIAAAKALYFQALRHGGSFAAAVRELAQSAGDRDADARDAAHVLGSIMARRGDDLAARRHLAMASELPGADGFIAAAKLALTFLYHGAPAEAARTLGEALRRLPGPERDWEIPALARAPRPSQTLFLFLARVLLALGRVHELGLLKAATERYPDTAFEYVRLAWEQGHTAPVLDVILACAARSDTESEILDILDAAIAEGVATDRQILASAELHTRLYSPDTAAGILKAFRRSMH